MGIKQKITEVNNHSGLLLFKEGIFYKLYNQHAMLFSENFKAYKVGVKFYKNVNQLVYSIGFPVSAFNPTQFGGNAKIVKSNNKVTITIGIINNKNKPTAKFVISSVAEKR